MGFAFKLDMQMKQEMGLKHKQLVTSDSHTTIMVLTEAYLSQDDHIKALHFAANRKNAHKYRSIMDFLWAETFGAEEKACCFDYYEGRGPQARYLYSVARIRWYDHCLLGVCVKAYELYCEKRRLKWAELAAAGRSMVLSPRPVNEVPESPVTLEDLLS